MIIRAEQIEQLDAHYRKALVVKVVEVMKHSLSPVIPVPTDEALTEMVRKGLNEAKKLGIRPDDERIAFVMLHIHHAAGAIPAEHFAIMRRDIKADSAVALSYAEHFRKQSAFANEETL